MIPRNSSTRSLMYKVKTNQFKAQLHKYMSNIIKQLTTRGAWRVTRDAGKPVYPNSSLVIRHSSLLLISLAAFGLAGGLVARGQTFYSLQLRPGWNVLANQLSRGSNTLAEVLPSVPAFSEFGYWDAAALRYVVSIFDPDFGGCDVPALA